MATELLRANWLVGSLVVMDDMISFKHAGSMGRVETIARAQVAGVDAKYTSLPRLFGLFGDMNFTIRSSDGRVLRLRSVPYKTAQQLKSILGVAF